MSVLTKKHPIKSGTRYATLRSDNGCVYRIPLNIAKKYEDKSTANKKVTKDPLAALEEKYTKAGVLLRGTRHREGLTQAQMAKKISVTQADLSKREHGKRAVGKIIAKRIQAEFGVNYRYFLE